MWLQTNFQCQYFKRHEENLKPSAKLGSGSPSAFWYGPLPMPLLLICMGGNHDTVYKYMSHPRSPLLVI